MKKSMTISSVAVLFLLGLVLAVSTAQAQANLTMRNSPRSMQGTRPLGMGGAFVAVEGTDENALFYNPAAINDYEKKIHMQFLLPTVEFSYKAISFFASDLPGLADDIDAAATNSDKISVFDAFAAANTGRYEEVGVHGNIATFMHKYLAASLFYENRSVLALTNPASSTVELEALSQGGLQVGSAYSFFDDHLQAGLAVKFMERHLIDETITQRAVIANADFSDILDLDNAAFGIGFDLGVKAKLPVSGKTWDYLNPRFAITLQDIGHTRFFAGDDVGRMNESLTAGFAIHPDFWKLKSTFAFDVRDLEYRTDFITKLHAGYELTWPEISKILRSASVRLGVSQGYFAAGFGVDFKYFKLNAATYGREIAEKTYQKQSRMFAFQLAAGF
jgi:hypothetical protein